MPLHNYEPLPTGETWLRMGNQAMGLQRNLQAMENVEEDRATQEKAATYAAEMTRNPNYRPDPNMAGYDPRADMGAQAAYLAQQSSWQNLDDAKKRSKADQLKQDYEAAQRSAADVTSWLRIAKSQYPDAVAVGDLPKGVKDNFKKAFLGAHHYIMDGKYSEENPDGTIAMKSQFGDSQEIIDPDKVTIKELEEFWMSKSQSLNDQATFAKTLYANKVASTKFSEEQWGNPFIVYDANTNQRAFRVDQINQETDKVDSYYFEKFPIRKDDVPMSADQVGRFSTNLGKVLDQKHAPGIAEAEAKTGMTAAQREEKRLKEKELGLRERRLTFDEQNQGDGAPEKPLTNKERADLELKVRKQYQETNTSKDRLGNEVKAGTPEGEQKYVDEFFARYAGGGQAKGLSTQPPQPPAPAGLSGPSGQGVRGNIGPAPANAAPVNAAPKTVTIKSKKSGEAIEVPVQEVMKDGTMLVLMPDGSPKFIKAQR